MRTYSYRFHKNTPQARQNFIVAALRKDGMTAYVETDEDRNDILKTNARVSEIAMSVGTATDINF